MGDYADPPAFQHTVPPFCAQVAPDLFDRGAAQPPFVAAVPRGVTGQGVTMRRFQAGAAARAFEGPTDGGAAGGLSCQWTTVGQKPAATVRENNSRQERCRSPAGHRPPDAPGGMTGSACPYESRMLTSQDAQSPTSRGHMTSRPVAIRPVRSAASPTPHSEGPVRSPRYGAPAAPGDLGANASGRRTGTVGAVPRASARRIHCEHQLRVRGRERPETPSRWSSPVRSRRRVMPGR